MSDPARLIFPGFTFGKQDIRDAERLAELGVGGFCLYRGKPAEILSFTKQMRRVASGPLLFCADYEEGAWAHVEGASALPTNLGVGASGSTSIARQKGRLTALEARAMGVDWVLAPVVDLLSRPANPIVDLRAFSGDAHDAARLARAFIDGLHDKGALGCLKHFPGHGATARDSHLQLPAVKASRALLSRRELVPFRKTISTADAVMLGHLFVPALSSGPRPFSLSPAGPRMLARWGFKGLIATDALDMGAIVKHWSQIDAALHALQAGVHILLVPRHPDYLIHELRRHVMASEKLTRLCALAGARLDFAISRVEGRRAPLTIVGSRPHAAAARKLFKDCAAWIRPLASPPSKKIAYFEPQNSRGPLQGRHFIAALAHAGIRVRVSCDGRCRPGETLVAGIFVVPRAYSGRIRLDSLAGKRLGSSLRAAKSAVVVSFGSPYAVPVALVNTPALCVFSRAPLAQKTAAELLFGARTRPQEIHG